MFSNGMLRSGVNASILALVVCGVACSGPHGGVDFVNRTPQKDVVSVDSTTPLTPPPQPTPAPPLVVPPPPPPEPPPVGDFTIEGVDSIGKGMLSLTISGVSTTMTTTGPIPAVSWAVYPNEDVRVERNGHIAYYAATEPRHVWFVASVNNPDPASKPFVAMKLVTVGGGPAPDPTPKPEDTKPKPVPADSLSSWVTANVNALVVGSTAKTVDCKTLADGFDSIASEEWKTPAEIVSRMEDVARIALDRNADKWQPFLDAMGDRLGSMADSGKLKTVADHIQMLKDISAGLRAVK